MRVRNKMKRDISFIIGQKELCLPLFYPSISSVKNTYTPEYYLQVLSLLTTLNEEYLVSAYDLASSKNPDNLNKLIESTKENRSIILLDSGNYESYWKEKKDIWQQSNYHDVLRTAIYDIAFCFDEQSPPTDIDEHVELIITNWREDQQKAGNHLVVPIVHGSASSLPSICKRVAEQTSINMIAVPERDLGEDIFSRAKVVKEIRKELGNLGHYVLLHLLGTGNPISIAIYTLQGADSFDGLEWCQTVIDHKSGFLHHYSHSEFFKEQTSWANSGLSFHVRTLAHNLEFYSKWMKQLQSANLEGTLLRFCHENLPDYVFNQCISNLGWSNDEYSNY